MEQSLRSEALRILELAKATYEPGVRLAAIYKCGVEQSVQFVVNPRDLAPTIFLRFKTFYLCSVQLYSKWEEKEAHVKAKEKQKEVARELHKGLCPLS